MRVLVTGHNGYIGSVMLPVLNAAGHTLAGLDTFFFEDCTLLEDPPRVPAARMDMRDVRPTDLDGFDALVHLAAVDEHVQGGPSDETIAEINHRSAVNLAEQAREAGVGRFLYASTCAVYGPGDEAFTENAPLRPLTACAAAKARAEEDILRLADTSFSPVILRSAIAYGLSPRLRSDTLLNYLVSWAHTTGRIRVVSDPDHCKPLFHVEDIAHAFASVLVAPRDAVHAHVFNVGSDSENYHLSELTEIVLAVVPGSSVENVLHHGNPDRSLRVNFGKLTRTFPELRPCWNAAFGAKDLYAALQDANVTHEALHQRYGRASRLRHLLEAGRVDRQLRWCNSDTPESPR